MLNKLKTKSLWVSLITLAVLIVSLGYTAYAIDNRPEPEKYLESQRRMLVTVETVKLGTYQSVVFSNAEVRPKYELNLSSELSGRIEQVHSSFESGRVLPKGSTLIEIDELRFRQDLALAQQNVAQANLNLQLEKQEGQQALLEWQDSELNGKADDLRLRKPQLKLAQAQLAQAKVALQLAQENLVKTKVQLPFDAVIAERLVAPGQFLQSGQVVATLYSADDFELTVMLKPSEWKLLFGDGKQELDARRIKLSSEQGEIWYAKIDRAGQSYDRQTRLRPLVLKVLNTPSQSVAVLSGDFVSVEIPGLNKAGLLAVPASSVSSQGDVWFVDGEKYLRNFQANVAFQHQGIVYLQPPKALGLELSALDILSAPLPHYVDGQKVDIRRVDQLAADPKGAVR